jgi:hypothetical protein
MSQTANLNNLFQGAAEEGMLTQGTANTLSMVDIGAQIQAGLGTNIDDIDASEVTLVAMLIDDSGSIRFRSNAQAVRDGHNLVLKSIADARQSGKTLVHTRYLNGEILYPFVTVDQAIQMNPQNFNPMGGTPLYDQSVIVLGTLVAEMLRYMDNGVPCRAILGIITDGNDQHSVKFRNPAEVKKVVDDILASELSVIISGMGISDGGSTDFTDIFQSMGILPEWIHDPSKYSTEAERESAVRKMFQMFSRSAVRASQSAGSFASMGGFAQP